MEAFEVKKNLYEALKKKLDAETKKGDPDVDVTQKILDQMSALERELRSATDHSNDSKPRENPIDFNVEKAEMQAGHDQHKIEVETAVGGKETKKEDFEIPLNQKNLPDRKRILYLYTNRSGIYSRQKI